MNYNMEINLNKEDEKIKNKKDTLKIFLIITLILVVIALLFIKYVIEVGLEWNSSNVELILGLLIMFLIPCGGCTVLLIFDLLLIKIIKIGDNKDLNFDLKLFREDLDKINPSYVYYIINSDINIKKVVSAEILKLVNDGYIYKENDKYYKTDKDISILCDSLKCIYNFAINNNEIDEGKYKEIIEQEMFERGYIKDINRKKIADDVFWYFPAFIFFSFLVIILLGKLAEKNEAFINILLITTAVFFIAFFSLPIIAIEYDRFKKKHNRTDKGRDLLYKSLGLKKFLEEFSNIEDKKIEELNIREYYLIYSLIFGLNDDEVNRVLNEEII